MSIAATLPPEVLKAIFSQFTTCLERSPGEERILTDPATCQRCYVSTFSKQMVTAHLHVMHCALVCRQWALPAQEILHKDLILEEDDDLPLLIRTLKSRPDLGAAVRILNVAIPYIWCGKHDTFEDNLQALFPMLPGLLCYGLHGAPTRSLPCHKHQLPSQRYNERLEHLYLDLPGNWPSAHPEYPPRIDDSFFEDLPTGIRYAHFRNFTVAPNFQLKFQNLDTLCVGELAPAKGPSIVLSMSTDTRRLFLAMKESRQLTVLHQVTSHLTYLRLEICRYSALSTGVLFPPLPTLKHLEILGQLHKNHIISMPANLVKFTWKCTAGSIYALSPLFRMLRSLRQPSYLPQLVCFPWLYFEETCIDDFMQIKPRIESAREALLKRGLTLMEPEHESYPMDDVSTLGKHHSRSSIKRHLSVS